MRWSLKVFLLLSIAILTIWISDHYYGDGKLGFYPLIALGGLPIIDMCTRKKKKS